LRGGAEVLELHLGAALAVNLHGEPRRQGDMRQRLRDAARAFGRSKAVLLGRNLFGNLNGVLSDRAERAAQIFGGVSVHEFPSGKSRTLLL
jgi:hypothetical protein